MIYISIPTFFVFLYEGNRPLRDWDTTAINSDTSKLTVAWIHSHFLGHI